MFSKRIAHPDGQRMNWTPKAESFPIGLHSRLFSARSLDSTAF